MAENTNFNLSFKYGEFKNLPTDISNGTIYVTTDDKTMYVDLNDKRIRLGDVSIHKTLTELAGDKASWYTGALAYIAEGNHLAYFDGAEWININDPGVQAKIEAAIAQEVKDRDAAIKVEKERAETAEAALSDKIDGVEEALAGITGTSGSLKTLEDSLKKYTDDAKAELIGGDTDTTTAKTIAGAKAFATNAAGNAVTTANEYTEDQIEGLELSYNNQTISLTNKAGTTVATLDASNFVKDGMLTGVSYNEEDNELTFTWNIAPDEGGATTTTINLTDLVDIYTGVQNGGIIVDGLNIKIDDTVVVTHTDLNTTVDAIIGGTSDTKDSSTITGAKKYADNVQTVLIGKSTDTKDSSTITGAKKYADDAVSTAKNDLIGKSTDTKASNTITGAKKYADDVANTAKQDATSVAEARAGELDTAVKTELIGKSTDTKASNTITGAKKYADDAATTAANAAKDVLIGTSSDTKTSNTITGAKKYADATQTAAQSYADGVAGTAEDNANAYTNARLTWGTF